MRLLTPEIAWHETLPIYSCDLQHRVTPFFGSAVATDAVKPAGRSPLADITSLATGDGPQSEQQMTADQIGTPGWTRLATAGGDNVVRLWRVRLAWVSPNATSGTGGAIELQLMGKKAIGGNNTAAHANLAEHLTYLASLRRHEKPVNVVRWSPSGDYLASAGDDLFIIIWSNQTGTGSAATDGAVGHVNKDGVDEDEEDEVAASSERWVPCRSLRRHLEDIYDLCWSPDSKGLISGSVDHSVIIWQLDLEPAPLPPTSSPSEAITTATLTPSTGSTVSVGGEKLDSAAVAGDAGGPSAVVQPTAGPAGTKNLIVRDHKHYVQGVTWDPSGYYVASLSSDRACRVYRAGTRTCLAHVSKAGKQRLFQDDSWKSFFRRLSFSPDGLLLACPAGNLEEAVFAGSVAAAASLATAVPTTTTTTETPAIPAVAPQHAAHIFLRSNFTRPVTSLPTGPRPVVTVRFCPQPFQLRPTNLLNGQNTDRRASLFDLPYRWLFCLVLEDGILFYDTQQTTPFAQVSQFHYQALNDATWSRDGHLVVVCSTDGYCSLIHFARGELGTPYHGPIGAQAVQSLSNPALAVSDPLPTEQVATNLTTQSIINDQNRPSQPQTDSDLPSVLRAPTEVQPSKTCEVPSRSHEDATENKPSVSNSNAAPGGVVTPTVRKRRIALTTLSSVPDIAPPVITPRFTALEINTAVVSEQSRTCTDDDGGGGDSGMKTPDVGKSSDQAIVTPVSARKRRVSFITLSEQPSPLVGQVSDSFVSLDSTSSNGISGLTTITTTTTTQPLDLNKPVGVGNQSCNEIVTVSDGNAESDGTGH